MSDQPKMGVNIQSPTTKDELEWLRQSEERHRRQEEDLFSAERSPETERPAMDDATGKENLTG